MKALVTGAGGFIGTALVASLLASDGSSDQRAKRLDHIVLVDSATPVRTADDSRVEIVTGDISDRALLERLVDGVDRVWHLAAVVSAAAESDFDLGYTVNLTATHQLLEVLRATERRPRIVFTSTTAVYGGELPDVLGDTFRLTPQTSYGTQKAIGELLVADYSRKGFVDGRCLRLPTVVVRPGIPNRAASAFASSIVREPLAGRDVVCPVRPETRMVITSPARVVEALMTAMALPEDVWRERRTVQLPGLTVEIGELVEALRRIGGDEVAARVRFEPDSEIERIVGSWPAAVSAERALQLGFRADDDVDEIVRTHVRDYASERTASTAAP